jgi:hypothetical protein
VHDQSFLAEGQGIKNAVSCLSESGDLNRNPCRAMVASSQSTMVIK